MKDPPFEIGDLVRLKRGHTVMTVRAVEHMRGRHKYTNEIVSGWFIRASYRSSERWHGTCEDGWEQWRVAQHYQRWDGDVPDNQGDEDMATEDQDNGVEIGTLFQVTGEDLFGTYMATNSKGQYVLEMKGKDGEVKAYNADAVEEVVPYTIGVRKVTSEGNSRSVIHWQVKPDAVVKGDLLVNGDGTRFVVKALDTKSKRTQKTPTDLRKIMTEAVTLS